VGKANSDRIGRGGGITADGVERAGAATCVVTQTLNEPACTVVPTVAGNSGTPAAVTPTDGDGGTRARPAATTTPSSLPFTVRTWKSWPSWVPERCWPVAC